MKKFLTDLPKELGLGFLMMCLLCVLVAAVGKNGGDYLGDLQKIISKRLKTPCEVHCLFLHEPSKGLRVNISIPRRVSSHYMEVVMLAIVEGIEHEMSIHPETPKMFQKIAVREIPLEVFIEFPVEPVKYETQQYIMAAFYEQNTFSFLSAMVSQGTVLGQHQQNISRKSCEEISNGFLRHHCDFNSIDRIRRKDVIDKFDW